MKRRITAISAITVLLLCGAVWARMTTVVVGQGAAAGCTDYSDTFTAADGTTVTGWTEVSGDWGVSSNQVYVEGGQYTNKWLRYNSSTDGIAQYGKVQMVECGEDGASHDADCGVVFRYDAVSGERYMLAIQRYYGRLYWRQSTNDTTNNAITFDTITYVEGNYLAWEINNTGTSTELKVWYGADPGERPWSSPLFTWTNSSGTYLADDGTSVGLFMSTENHSPAHTFRADNFLSGPCQ